MAAAGEQHAAGGRDFRTCQTYSVIDNVWYGTFSVYVHSFHLFLWLLRFDHQARQIVVNGYEINEVSDDDVVRDVRNSARPGLAAASSEMICSTAHSTTVLLV